MWRTPAGALPQTHVWVAVRQGRSRKKRGTITAWKKRFRSWTCSWILCMRSSRSFSGCGRRRHPKALWGSPTHQIIAWNQLCLKGQKLFAAAGALVPESFWRKKLWSWWKLMPSTPSLSCESRYSGNPSRIQSGWWQMISLVVWRKMRPVSSWIFTWPKLLLKRRALWRSWASSLATSGDETRCSPCFEF